MGFGWLSTRAARKSSAWPGHAWVFDLISDDELAREQALGIHQQLIADLRDAANYRRNHWDSKSADLAYNRASDRAIHGPLHDYCWNRRRRRTAEDLERIAITYLRWERAYPESWGAPESRYYTKHGWKDDILRRMAQYGVLENNHRDVAELVLAAVRGPYRCKDWRYARVAKLVDSPSLRYELEAIALGPDRDAATRAEFVLSRLERPELSANIRSFGNWLAHRGQTSSSQ